MPHQTARLIQFILLPIVLATPIVSHAIALSTSSQGKIYVGAFGGGGASSNLNAVQYGTAFFTEAEGGPLAVNAFGEIKNHSMGFGGAQIGYQAPEILLNSNSQLTLSPAVELEGYYISKNSFTGSLLNNTDRLPEHDFDVSYPIKRSVFLINTVFTLNQPCLLLHPYVGLGIGGALVKISDADSSQVSPLETDINHYNGNPSDMNTTFAGQVKLGLSYDISDMISVFAEYRWLYLASTDFTFGSTVYPIHAPTSSWHVQLDPQKYNLGSVGIRVKF